MRLKGSFFNRDTSTVAQELLGKTIVVRRGNGEKTKATITETEAYHGFDDKASHASRKKTERNGIMFEKAGLVYVYLVYGMHWCLNFVTMSKNFPAAVLIRSVIVDNSKIKNQKSKSQLKIQKFKNYFEIKNYKIKNFIPIEGPGRVCKYLGIDRSFYGEDLTESKRIWIEDGIKIKKSNIIKSQRIGVDYAGECAKWEWNYRIDF